VVRYAYTIPVPQPGRYVEVLNSDAGEYGGSNVRNTQDMWAQPDGFPGYQHALRLTLPPLGAVLLRRVTGATAQ